MTTVTHTAVDLPPPDTCDREDCRIVHRGRTKTALAWYPVFDKQGNQLNSDPNVFEYDRECRTCQKHWVQKERYGKIISVHLIEINHELPPHE